MTIYCDGWVGYGAKLPGNGPNGHSGDPSPFGVGYVRTVDLPAVIEPQDAYHYVTEPTLSPPPAALPTLEVTDTRVSSLDPRTLWVFFNQPVRPDSGRVVVSGLPRYSKILVTVTVAGSAARVLPYISAIDQPKPWIIRLRIPEDVASVRNDTGTTTPLAKTGVTVTFPANTLRRRDNTGNTAITTDPLNHYPDWTLVAPKWHSKLAGTVGAPFAPLWAVLYSAFGRLSFPPEARAIKELYQFPTTGPTISSVSPGWWDAMVAPNLGVRFRDRAGTVSYAVGRPARVVLETAEDATPTLATVMVGDERIYNLIVKRDAAFVGPTMPVGGAVQLMIDGSAPYHIVTTNGAFSVRGQEVCTGSGGGSVAVIRPYGRVQGGNFFATSSNAALDTAARTAKTALDASTPAAPNYVALLTAYNTAFEAAEVAKTYPAVKPFIYALTVNGAGIPQDPIGPKDWTYLDLPFNYLHGDPIPQRKAPASPVQDATKIQMPRGVGYVRLMRGSVAVGNRAWDADQDLTPDTNLIAPVFTGAIWDAAKASEVLLYTDRPVKDADIAKITITPTPIGTVQIVADGASLRLTFPAPLTGLTAAALSFACREGLTHNAGSDVKSVAATVPVVVGSLAPARNATPLVAQSSAAAGSFTGALITKIRVYYNMPVYVNLATTSLPTLTGTAAVVTAVAAGPSAQGSSEASAKPSYYAELSLQGGITDAEVAAGPISVTVAPNTVSATREAPSVPPGTSSGATFLCRFVQPRLCYVPIVNRMTARDYQTGDLVTLPTTLVALADSLGATRSVYDSTILEGSIQGPHKHLIEGNGPFGGGAAYATPVPASARAFLEVGWLPGM